MKNYIVGVLGIFLLVLSLCMITFSDEFGVIGYENLMTLKSSMLLLCSQAFWFIYNSFLCGNKIYKLAITLIQFILLVIFLWLARELIVDYPKIGAINLVGGLLIVVLYSVNMRSKA